MDNTFVEKNVHKYQICTGAWDPGAWGGVGLPLESGIYIPLPWIKIVIWPLNMYILYEYVCIYNLGTYFTLKNVQQYVALQSPKLIILKLIKCTIMQFKK